MIAEILKGEIMKEMTYRKEFQKHKFQNTRFSNKVHQLKKLLHIKIVKFKSTF